MHKTLILLYIVIKLLRLLFTIFTCTVLLVSCQRAESVGYLKLSGHRGAECVAPENTMASVDTCIKYGVDFIECDVCISKDSVFYLLHDSILDRTTNGAGEIGQWMSADIDTLDAGVWFDAKFEGQRVPRLEDVLVQIKEHSDLGITIDYRNGGLERLLALIDKVGMLDRCTFTFSDEEDAKEFRRLVPDKKMLQAYIRCESDFERVLTELRPDIAVVWLDSIDSLFVDKCHTAGLKVLALAMDGERHNDADYEKAISLNVDLLGTRQPLYFVKKYRR